MPSSDHNRTKNQLTQTLPTPAETVHVPGDSHRNPHAPIPAHDIEEEVENAENGRVLGEFVRFDDGDEEEGEHDCPGVVRELGEQLVEDEGFVKTEGGVGVGEDAYLAGVGGYLRLLVSRRRHVERESRR